MVDIGNSLLDFTAENQAATFRNANRLLAVQPIAKAEWARVLVPAHQTLSTRQMIDLPGGGQDSVADYMTRNRTAGFLMLKSGRIVAERYAMGCGRASRWTSFSVAKSVVSTLIGVALHEGAIGSLDDPVTQYVTALRGSPYEDNSIRDCLRMSSGVAWIEDYVLDGVSDIVRLGQVLHDRETGGLMRLMADRGRVAAPGARFLYSTGETCVLGAVLVAATGRPVGDYLSDKIWQPLGMEADAYWAAESRDGLVLGGGNFSARLRDYARFGQFFLRGGDTGQGVILPQGWCAEAAYPSSPATQFGKLEPDNPMGYGYQWWSLPPDLGQAHAGAYAAQGIFGQFLYINPAADVVAVVWSAWPEAWVVPSELETYAMIGAAMAAVA